MSSYFTATWNTFSFQMAVTNCVVMEKQGEDMYFNLGWGDGRGMWGGGTQLSNKTSVVLPLQRF